MKTKTLPRGVRNCNPGNIRRSAVRYLGEIVPSGDPEFRQFRSMAWGFRALFVLLETYRRRYGLRSVAQIITRWAPPSENHTEAYIRRVAAALGRAADAPLDLDDSATAQGLAAAIATVECGAAPDPGDVEAGWRLFRDHPA